MPGQTLMSQKESFLNHLRSSTKEYHVKLEELPVSTALLSPDVSPDQYKNYLQTMYGFVVSFEAVYFPLLKEVFPDLELRRKTDLLENDLKKLGLTDKEISILPCWKTTTEPNLNDALGAMYVMEGSTLGGAIIYRHIYKTLGLGAESGASYFQPYGEKTGSFWKEFMSVFCNFSLSNQNENEVVAAASQTFKDIHDWFAAVA